MNSQQQQKKKEKEGVEEEKTKEGKESQPTKAKSTSITSSPPSASSSPSHEFSFTISLHPSSAVPDKSKSSPPSFAIDLSPADDIFFHGHLLPLHLLSHLPISPRASTNSYESFSLPIDDHKLNRNKSINTNNNTKGRSKAKSFSLFRFSRRRKGSEVVEKEKHEEEEMKKKRKLRFNMSHLFRRYVRIIRPLLIFKGTRKDGAQHLRRQPYSFSGNLSWKGKQELKGRRGEFSAPASLWTSPTNSGPLVANSSYPSSKSDSTMEELQGAIQAAIAHCKSSIALKEEKIIC